MKKRIDILYQQYLSGQLSKADFEQLQRKVAQTSDDELWNLMCEDISLSSIPTEMPQETQQRILQNISFELQKKPRQKHIKAVLRYASIVLLVVSLLGGGYWWLQSLSKPAPVYTYVNVKAGSKSMITLPDGTHVTINGNSLLRYHVVPKEVREVVLMKGEAYFDVAKDATCPFKVHVNNMNIEVLGTKFNVRWHEDEIETALFSGSVRLTASHVAQSYQLAPGKKSVYNTTAHHITIRDNDAATDGRWKEGYLAFNSRPLSEVLQEIENWYGVTIQLRNKKLANDKLTGSFYHETLESVLHSLSMQYGFEYDVGHDHVTIE